MSLGKHYYGATESPIQLKQKKSTEQDAQKVQTSHPPNPGSYFTLPP